MVCAADHRVPHGLAAHTRTTGRCGDPGQGRCAYAALSSFAEKSSGLPGKGVRVMVEKGWMS
jgi:hypothetical protein